MARIIPDGWRELAISGTDAADVPATARRHHETLSLFATGLPDDYTIYHAVHWTNVERGFSVFGEIDFVIVDRNPLALPPAELRSLRVLTTIKEDRVVYGADSL